MFFTSYYALVQWQSLHLELLTEGIRSQRLHEDQLESGTAVHEGEQNEHEKRMSEISEAQSRLRAKMTEELSAFKADKLAYFNRGFGTKKKNIQHVDKVSLGLKWSIQAASRPVALSKVIAENRAPCLLEAVHLTCLALHGLRSELDELPPNIVVPDHLIAGHIAALLTLAVRLPAFQERDDVEFQIRFGEFTRDWARFEKWIKKHHPFQPKQSRLSLLGRMGSGLNSLIRGAFSRLTDDSVPESLVQELILELQALTADGETSANDISSIAGPDAAESVDAINSTDEVKTVQGDVPAVWKGPLVNPEDVSKKLLALGKEISAQALRNHYWQKWKPQDHMKGRALFFYWDRIMPIVEEQFGVKFEDQ